MNIQMEEMHRTSFERMREGDRASMPSSGTATFLESSQALTWKFSKPHNGYPNGVNNCHHAYMMKHT